MADRNLIDRRVLPALALAMPIVALVLANHITADASWVTTFEAAVSCGLFACTIATAIAVIGRKPRLAIGIVAFLLTANTAFILSTLTSAKLVVLPGPDPKFALILSAMTMLGVIGLVVRRPWARWMCLALGCAGLGSGGLNAFNFWSITGTPDPVHVDWYLFNCRVEWIYFVNALGSALIILNLVAARGAFVASGVWSGREPVMHALRLSLIASFAAVPMLLVYAWMQPVVPETKTTAIVIAAALAIGGALAVRGKLVGALVLVVAGLGLVAQTLATMLLADDRFLPTYYAVFWTPAALLAIVSGALLAKPMLRLLRR
jgi:hypothetical protein